ncbi:anti-sigma factor family protein [Alicycliphilus denitrificans]|uniref:anti-sigma factor family protein n=1 Tax=Alicycliphilus denitrificans TaxID=179636 RepID=UPI00384DE649
MTCPRTEDLSAYADQALPARRQAALRQHLLACPVCRQQLDALQALRQELHALPSPTLGFDLAAQLQDRLPRRAPRPRRTGWSLAGWLPTGLATGAALVSGLWLGGLLLGTGAAVPAASPAMARVFDPVPPGGLCAAAEICRLPRTLP